MEIFLAVPQKQTQILSEEEYRHPEPYSISDFSYTMSGTQLKITRHTKVQGTENPREKKAETVLIVLQDAD